MRFISRCRLFFPYSTVALICCALFTFPGCFRPAIPYAEEEARGSLALHAAADQYGVISDAEIQSYLYYLGSRLITGLNRVGKRCENCDLTLLNTTTPLAYSPGPGHIVLSRGMLVRLGNEAELAFVVAHEMAHQILGHHQELVALGSNPAAEEREDLEKKADSFAVGLLAVSGYDPRFAPSALLHAYGKVTPDGNSLGYPDLYAREALIEQTIIDSHWQPPGTGERREFEIIKRRLILNQRATQ